MLLVWLLDDRGKEIVVDAYILLITSDKTRFLTDVVCSCCGDDKGLFIGLFDDEDEFKRDDDEQEDNERGGVGAIKPMGGMLLLLSLINKRFAGLELPLMPPSLLANLGSIVSLRLCISSWSSMLESYSFLLLMIVFLWLKSDI
jgi:hypothetical protein